MKEFKILLIAILGVALPFAILGASVKYNALAEFAETICFLFPLYLPVLFAWFGIKIFKTTDEILSPIILFDLILVFVIFLLTHILFSVIERSLSAAVIGLLLIGPLFYSVPISFIAAAIYRHKKKKAQAHNNYEDDTYNEAQI